MLKDEDLSTLISIYKECESGDVVPVSPKEILLDENGLYPEEIFRLKRSLKISAVLGEIGYSAISALNLITEEMRDLRYSDLSNKDAWLRSFAWARIQPGYVASTSSPEPLAAERAGVVGSACRRLRNKKYKISVGAYGPTISASSREELVRAIDGLISLLGGAETASQILRFLRDANLYHDGMWLFGEMGLSLYDTKRPMIPVGWLFSMALRHSGRPGRARKPEVAWKSIINLATDFAAAHDCQRYSEYEEIDLHPSQFHGALANSILWRELFTLPQMPPIALQRILDVLAEVMTSSDKAVFGISLDGLLREIRQLLAQATDDLLTIFQRKGLERQFPLLSRSTEGFVKKANSRYGDPLNATERTQDDILLFEQGEDQAIALPRAFLASAACNVIFGLIRSKLSPQRTADIIAETLEKAIARTCENKAPIILAQQKYNVGRQTYEFDVATRDGEKAVLFEVKSKMLTRQSRLGDMVSFFRDYSDGFLRMLLQLVRHEKNIREGFTPLITSSEITPAFRPIKVAVSPLSFGPVSDKMLSSSLLRSLSRVKFHLIVPDKEKQIAIDHFNTRVSSLFVEMTSVLDNLSSDKEDRRQVSFQSYLVDCFWFDIGELIYILERANNVWDAFVPLQYISFSSRDFWTELAYADRSGLTAGKWRQVGSS